MSACAKSPVCLAVKRRHQWCFAMPRNFWSIVDGLAVKSPLKKSVRTDTNVRAYRYKTPFALPQTVAWPSYQRSRDLHVTTSGESQWGYRRILWPVQGNHLAPTGESPRWYRKIGYGTDRVAVLMLTVGQHGCRRMAVILL